MKISASKTGSFWKPVAERTDYPTDLSLAAYHEFLKRKCEISTDFGYQIEPDDIHPFLKPHQRAAVQWAVRGGRRALFESFGLGKTVQQLEILRLILQRTGGRGLVVAPLGVRQEFKRDAKKVDIKIEFIRSLEETDPTGIYITNYETVRDGKLNPADFMVTSLDEAAVLRSFGGTKTYREFMRLFETVPYRFVATATPDPNEYIELLAYAAYLGIMDVSQAKTRFFKRDSVHADRLTIHPHKEAEFWLWVASWALFLSKPSDLGYPDTGYALPEMEVIYHEVKVDHTTGTTEERDGQMRMFRNASLGVTDAAREKRNTLPERLQKMVDIVKELKRDTTRTQPEILSGESGAGTPEEPGLLPHDRQRPNRPRKEKGVYEGVQPDAPQEAPTHAGTAGSTPPALPDGPGVSGEMQGPSTGKRIPKARGKKKQPAQDGLRDNKPPVRRASEKSTERLCNLRSDPDRSSGAQQKRAETGSGPQPQDRAGTRDSVSQVQLRIGAVPGEPSSANESSRIPQFIVWCDLNIEQRGVDAALDSMGISYSSLYGADDLEDREQSLGEWKDGKTTAFISKPIMYGAGVNLQQCSTAIFLGIGFKFSEFIQAIKRIHRFLQQRPVKIHIIYAESERHVLERLLEKWNRHKERTEKMSEIIQEHGLSQAAMMSALQRSMGVERVEVSGDGYQLVNNDSVEEIQRMAENTVDLILTSIPFSTQYEYTPSYNDFGHTDSNQNFFEQMEFLTPHLLRVLKPGRIAAIHVKDRIIPGGITGLGFQTVYPFHCDCIAHFNKHGFAYMGMKTIVTDVVRENNQTYRLGWTEQCKDGTKMGVGMPEYLLLFRKPPTDNTNSYADQPVVKLKRQYSRSRWQIDAHAFMRSSGNRLLTPEELEGLNHAAIFKLFRKFSMEHVYDFEHHVKLGEALETKGILPVTFMLLQPQSWHPDVWTDITRMRTLNGAQSAKGREMHLCLARDSMVLTRENGYTPIQNVQAGDQVLTHMGRWRTVQIVRETGIQPIVTIHAHGTPGLRLTPDHKCWARTTGWTREREGAERAEPTWIEASETLAGYLNFKLPEPEVPHVTDLLKWWIVGRWIADGHWESRGAAILSCGNHELETLKTRLANHCGGSYWTQTAWQVRVLDPDGTIKEILRQCGHGADGKHLPPQAFTLPWEQAQALLDGYLSGDGHFLEDRQRWNVTAVNRTLLLGMAVLAQRAYESIASLYKGRPARDSQIEGRTVQCKQEWVFSFDLPTNRRKQQFILPDGAWKKVRSIEDSGEAETWCLRVEEDESFTVDGCIVKNCPMQFDLADRVIAQFCQEGELVFDPFGGLMTVPYRAVMLHRKALAIELNPRYFLDGCNYTAQASKEAKMPGLFDLEEEESDTLPEDASEPLEASPEADGSTV